EKSALKQEVDELKGRISAPGSPKALVGSPVGSPKAVGASGVRGSGMAGVGGAAPFEFRWSLGGHAVTVTGTFDQWTRSTHLTRQPDGTFRGTVDIPFGSRVLYKFVVDGIWRIDPEQPTEVDSTGIMNNVAVAGPSEWLH
ncbi:hypothetical protein HK097_002926, partial [Rhizophlyctis rosea]